MQNTPLTIEQIIILISAPVITIAIMAGIVLFLGSHSARKLKKASERIDISIALSRIPGMTEYPMHEIKETIEAWENIKLPLPQKILYIKAHIQPSQLQDKEIRNLTKEQLQTLAALHN